jgi:hypothetical protein
VNRPVSFDATLTAKRAESKYASRPVGLQTLTVVLVALACTALVLDAAMTPEQRVAQFVQWGNFP